MPQSAAAGNASEGHTNEDLPAARHDHRHTVLTEPAPSLDVPLLQTITARGAVTAASATAAWAIGR